MDSNINEELNQSMFIFEEDEQHDPVENEEEEEEEKNKYIATKSSSSSEDEKSNQVPNIVDPLSVIKEDVKIETTTESVNNNNNNYNNSSCKEDDNKYNDDLNDSISDFLPFLEQFDEVQKDKEDEREEEKDESDSKFVDENPPFKKPPPMFGFSTANGKPVTISKAALDRVKNMWEDEDDFIPNNNNIEMGGQGFSFSTVNNKPSVGFTTPKLSSTIKQESINNEHGHDHQSEEKEEEEKQDDNDDDDEREKKSQSESNSPSAAKLSKSSFNESFSLSNGNFSRNTIERVKNMFKDENIDIDKPVFITAASNVYTTTPTSTLPIKPGFITSASNVYTTTPTSTDKPLPINTSTLKHFGLSKVKRKSAPSNLSTTPSSSFRSIGLSKKSNLSEGSLKGRFKNNLNNINDNSKLTSPFRVPLKMSPKITTKNNTNSFHVNQSNSTTTSSAINYNYQNGNGKPSLEISTANGKPVSISNSSLNKVKDMWKEEEEEEEDGDDALVPTLPMKSEMNRPTSIDVSPSKQNQLESDDERSKSPLLTPSFHHSPPTTPPKQQNFGFSTGNGKAVQVSKEALNRVRSMWQDEFEDEQEQKEQNNGEISHENQEQIVDVNKQFAFHNFQSPIIQPSTSNNPSFGFSTGSGKAVKVSEEALNRVKNMWKDELKEDQVPEKISCNKFKSPLIKSPTVKSIPFGFSTGSGKAVQVSEEALNRVKNMFKDEFDDEQQQTSREEAHEDVGNIPVSTMKTPSFGFSTGSGKAVKVSEEALNRVRSLWNDEFKEDKVSENISCNKFTSPLIQPSNNPSSFGFSTGSGKAVKVSEEALNKVRNMFKDEFKEEQQNGQNNEEDRAKEKETKTFQSPIIHTPTINNPSSFGFSTGSGKSVQVSKSALDKVKNMFKDDEENLRIEDISPIKSLKRGRNLLEDDNNKFITPSKSARLSIYRTNINATNTSTPVSYNTLRTPNSSILNDMTLSQRHEIDELSKDCLADDESGSSFLLDGVSKEQVETMDVDKPATITTEGGMQGQSVVNSNDENEEIEPVPFNDIPFRQDKTTGEIPLIHGVIVRTYPLCYFCKQDPDGKSGFISRSRFEKIQNENEEKRQELSERLLIELTNEYESNKNKSASLRRKSIGKGTRKLEDLPTEVLVDMIQSEEDFSEIREQISFRKLQELQEEYRSQMEKQRMEIQDEVKTRTDKQIAMIDKKTSLCLRIRLLDVSTVESQEESLKSINNNNTNNNNNRKPLSVVLSIYRPNEAYQTNLTEGSAFGFSSIKFAKMQDEEYRLNSGSKTVISLIDNSLDKSRKSDIISRFKRHCSTFEEISSDNFNPDFGEFDTVGLVVYIKEKKEKPNKLKELVYIVNESEEIIVLGFWSSLKEQGLEKIIKEGNFISIINLQWRKMSSRERPIRRGFVQETTEFSLKPKESTMKENLNRLKAAIEDVDEYLTLCTEKIFSICKSKKSYNNNNNSDENEDDNMKTPPLRRHIPPLTDQNNDTSPYKINKRNLVEEF